MQRIAVFVVAHVLLTSKMSSLPESSDLKEKNVSVTNVCTSGVYWKKHVSTVDLRLSLGLLKRTLGMSAINNCKSLRH